MKDLKNTQRLVEHSKIALRNRSINYIKTQWYFQNRWWNKFGK